MRITKFHGLLVSVLSGLVLMTGALTATVLAATPSPPEEIASGLASTEERSQQVTASEPDAEVQTVVSGKLEPTAQPEPRMEKTTWLDQLQESFHSNILHENRYLLIVDGLKTTAIISVWSIVLGTLAGGGIAYLRMHRSVWLNRPARGFIAIIRGTPILVILMLTFYVVFAAVNIDPVLVSILAFGMNFAAYVSEMYRSGIEAVDSGQTEAGIAMGFTRLQTFVFIVAPQALRHILPVYKGEMISLVKMTSIVGYIAVQDLTRAGDIIRSRTFDAFFPLVMVAVLYFLISYGLLILLSRLETRIEPKRKTYRSLS